MVLLHKAHLSHGLCTKGGFDGPAYFNEPIIDGQSDPSHIAERDDTISYAFMVLLDQLSTQERAIFILRETMAYEYHEIAQILGKSESNCRKILSRAKSKLKHPEIAPVQQESELAKNFIRGIHNGNFDDFLKLVSEDAVMKSDGGGKVRAAIRPVFGRAKIGRFLNGLHARGYFHGDLQIRNVNFHCGIAKYYEGRVEFVIRFDLAKSSTPVQGIFLIANPDKLRN